MSALTPGSIDISPSSGSSASDLTLKRVEKACAPCRYRKRKCDGARPHCSSCLRHGRQLECVYVDKIDAETKSHVKRKLGADDDASSISTSSGSAPILDSRSPEDCEEYMPVQTQQSMAQLETKVTILTRENRRLNELVRKLQEENQSLRQSVERWPHSPGSPQRGADLIADRGLAGTVLRSNESKVLSSNSAVNAPDYIYFVCFSFSFSG